MLECIKQVVASHLIEAVAVMVRDALGGNVLVSIIAADTKDEERQELQRTLRDRHDLDVYDPRKYILVPFGQKGPEGPARPEADFTGATVTEAKLAGNAQSIASTLEAWAPHSDIGAIVDRAAYHGYSVSLSMYPPEKKNEDDDPNRV